MSARDGTAVRSGKFSNCLASVLVSHAASAVLLASGSGQSGAERVVSRGAPWANCSTLLSCIISRDPMGARSWSERRRQAPPAQSPGPKATHTSTTTLNLNKPQPAMDISTLYNASTVQERLRLESGAFRDRQVRLQSVQTDLLLDMPHPIALPDGEGSCDVKIMHLHDTEEIYRGYIRPPPNRTVWQGECPPPPPPYQRTTGEHKGDSNSRSHRSSYPPGTASGTPQAGCVEYSDPPPCYSDAIASPNYHRTSAGVANSHKSEL